MNMTEILLIVVGVGLVALLRDNYKFRTERGATRMALKEFHTALEALRTNLVANQLQTEYRFIACDGLLDAFLTSLAQFDERIGMLEPQVRDDDES